MWQRCAVMVVAVSLTMGGFGCDSSDEAEGQPEPSAANQAAQAEEPSPEAESGEVGTHHDPSAEQRQPSKVHEDGSRLFGQALSDEREATELEAIANEPDRYADEVVKTSGTIDQVCEKMGCWMELRSGGGTAVRVPMAGHSFFLPQDVKGSDATVEGRVATRELSDSEREHLRAEGAQAVAQALEIEATGVLVR